MHMFPPTLICETSTTADGNMDFRFDEKDTVIHNRTAFLKKYDIPYSNHIAMRGEHDDVITLVDNTHKALGATSRETQVRTEVLVTQSTNVALLLTTADCQGVSFYDPVTKTIALAHISRKTLTLELPRKTIDFLMQECGVEPTNLCVHVGPSIHRESYAFTLPLETVDPSIAPYIHYKDNNAYIDLIGAHLDALLACGVHKERITVSHIDTRTSPEHFSYYAMKKGDEPNEARMANILMMR